MGQALHTGLWSNKHGNSISVSMPRKEGAHLYATSYWNRGVLLASTMQCREAVATAIRDLDLPTISPIISARLYQHSSRKLTESRVEADHHGWEGAKSHLVGTTTVTDPVSGEEVPFIPRRRHPGHVPATPQRFRDVLNSHITSFFEASERRPAAAHLVAQPWHFLVTTGACSGHHCPSKETGIPKSGMVLMNGVVLCRVCHRKWEHHVRKQLGFHHTPKCPRDGDGRCLSCTSMDDRSRQKLRSLLIRDQIRDLTHALFSHLATNAQGYVANILFRHVRSLHRGQDHLLMISVPVVIHSKILGLIAWHYYDRTVRFIQSVPKHDYAASEPWAMECRKELATIHLHPVQPSPSRPLDIVEEEEEFFRGSASLKALRIQLRSHSSMSTSLLHTPAGCRLLYDRLGIQELSRPEPADWCIRHTSEARCKICGVFENDLMEVPEGEPVGDPVYNCMSCNGWWHESCMSATDRQTLPTELIANVEDGAAPPWRCQECVKKDQYAVQRILEVVRGEDGKFYLLLEYLGYRYLEVRLESRLVDKNAELRRAYREHANTRSSISMLYCAGAILDAMWHGQSTKDLGMDLKLIHQDARLYLISHASLQKRGFAPGMASVIQMLVAQEHRLVIPFSLRNLQCTLEGTSIPPSLPRDIGDAAQKRSAEPSLQALATHLSALSHHTSLPMALAEATKGATEWEGLGLLSGSSIKDIATALSLFCSEYGPSHWNELLRKELPDLTDEDIDWLCGLTEAAEALEPLSMASPGTFIVPESRTQPSKRRRGGNGRAMAHTRELSDGTSSQFIPTEGIVSGRKRRPAALSLPSRRSPRLHLEQSTPAIREGRREADAQPDLEPAQPPPPSQLAAAQRPYRIQLSRARRRLHGGLQEQGMLYFLQMFTAYMQFIGRQYSTTEQDPVIFFETKDLMSTRDWKAVPAALDRNQPTTKFGQGLLDRSENPLTDRSSGIGPMHGVEP